MINYNMNKNNNNMIISNIINNKNNNKMNLTKIRKIHLIQMNKQIKKFLNMKITFYKLKFNKTIHENIFIFYIVKSLNYSNFLN